MKKTLLIASLLINILVNAQSTNPIDSLNLALEDYLIRETGLLQLVDSIYVQINSFSNIEEKYITKTDTSLACLLANTEDKSFMRIYYFTTARDNKDYCFKSILIVKEIVSLDNIKQQYNQTYQKVNNTEWYVPIIDDIYISININLRNDLYTIIHEVKKVEYDTNN